MLHKSLPVLLLFIASCSTSQKTNSTTAVQNPVSNAIKAASPIGNWKLSAIQILETPLSLRIEAKKLFEEQVLEKGAISFNADSTYTLATVEGDEKGTWQSDAGNKTLYLVRKDFATDTLNVSELTWHYLKGKLHLGNSTAMQVEFTRVQ
jgi:hypothetical protein